VQKDEPCCDKGGPAGRGTEVRSLGVAPDESHHAHTTCCNVLQAQRRSAGEDADEEDITENKSGRVWLVGEQRWERR